MSKSKKVEIETIGPGEFKRPDDLRKAKPEISTTLKLPEPILKAMSGTVKNPIGVFAWGYEMEPAIMNGSVLVVDPDDRIIVENDLYLLEFPYNSRNRITGLNVKRVLEIYEHGVLLGVDDPECPKWFLENDALKVMGKIKFTGAPTGKLGEYVFSQVYNGARNIQ